MTGRTVFQVDKTASSSEKILGRIRKCSSHTDTYCLITYCLIGIIEHDLSLRRPVFQVMRILGSSLLTKDNIMDLFSSPKDMEEPNDGQLKIDFDFN